MRRPIVQFLPEGPKQFLRVFAIPALRHYFCHSSFPLGKGILWRHVVAHLLWLETYVEADTVFGSRLRVDVRDFLGRYIYYFGIWEPNLTRWIRERLHSGDTFVDIGANIGYYSVLAAQLANKVVAIEAGPRAFAILETNLAANHAANVRPINVAVWDREESLTMFDGPDTAACTGTVMPGWAGKWGLTGRCEVRATPLSNVLEAEEIRTARLIKIDVEGAEWHVLSGMSSVFENGREDLEVIVEVSHGMLEAEGRTCADLLAFFENRDFFPYRIDNDYSIASYCDKSNAHRPERIKAIPTDIDTVDLIFSRIDAATL